MYMILGRAIPTTYFEAEVHPILSEILRGLKKGQEKEIIFGTPPDS